MEAVKTKQQYQSPVLEIKKIEKQDVLTSSGNMPGWDLTDQ